MSWSLNFVKQIDDSSRPFLSYFAPATTGYDMKFEPLDFGKIRTYPLRERENKVRLEEFAGVWQKGGSLDSFLKSIPRILVGQDFRDVVSAIASAAKKKKP